MTDGAEGWWLDDNLIDSGHDPFLNKFLKILPHRWIQYLITDKLDQPF
jgi:hypothetical protein